MIDSGAAGRYKEAMEPPADHHAGGPAASADRIPVAEPASPLNEVHYQILRQAMAARRPVLRAVRTARFSAMSILIIGAISLPLAMMSRGWDGLLIAVVICVIGGIEYIGSQRLQQGEPSSASLLGANQLAFMLLIVCYCVMQMMVFSPEETASALGARPSSQGQSPANPLLDVDKILRVWVPAAAYGFYALVIVLSLIFQGGLALYYFTRRPHLEAARRQTPAWVRRLLTEVGA